MRFTIWFIALLIVIVSAPLKLSSQATARDYLRLAVECTMKKDFVGAIALCNLSLSLDSTNAVTYYHRAYNRFHLHNYDGVIKDTSSALRINPDFTDAYLLRAEARLKKGERFGALADYNRARQVDSAVTLIHFFQNAISLLF